MPTECADHRSRRFPTDLSIKLVGAVGALVLASCSTATGTPSSTTSLPITSESTTTSAPSGGSSVPAVLTPSQVFATVAPAVAFVETPISTGSGVLLPGARLLTNAHVVWPSTEARVVFSDGTELVAAPVLAWDLMGDLALLDVAGVDHLPDAARFGDGESETIGTELFLIGYPAEVDRFPQPTLTSGVLSRFRTWEAAGMTYLQTDAVIAGGQSGGALVSGHGEVIGISGLLFAEGFALAASAPDALARVQTVVSNGQIDGLTLRPLTGEGEPLDKTEAELANFIDEATWVFFPEAGDEITIEATSTGDVSLAVVSSDGFVEVFADESESDPETGTFEAVVDAAHVVAVSVIADGRATAEVESSVPLRVFTDPDHGRSIHPGETITAAVDYPTDVDYFLIDLSAGQTVTIAVDSMNFDASLVVDRAGNLGEVLGSDDDSGGGVMGWDPRVTFTADASATYLIGVIDQTGVGPAGYFLSVGED